MVRCWRSDLTKLDVFINGTQAFFVAQIAGQVTNGFQKTEKELRLRIIFAGEKTFFPWVDWWDSGTVLASCAPAGHAAAQLWLVPVNGTRPRALTPPRAASSRDLGDLDAWSLAGGLYLQSAGPCGVLQIFRQASGGAITLVSVPHTVGDNHALTVDGARMLVQAPTSCTGSVSLLWFNPATHAEQWLVRAPASATGAAIAIPFYSRENGNL